MVHLSSVRSSDRNQKEPSPYQMHGLGEIMRGYDPGNQQYQNGDGIKHPAAAADTLLGRERRRNPLCRFCASFVQNCLRVLALFCKGAACIIVGRG